MSWSPISSLQRVEQEIELLREELKKADQSCLSSPPVVHLSQQLDSKLNLYQQLTILRGAGTLFLVS